MLALSVLQTLATRGAIASTRVKDIKTSLKKLADAADVAVEALDLTVMEATYADTLKRFFAALEPPASKHTARNTSQNLRQLYEKAREAALLPGKHTTAPSTRQTRDDIRLAVMKGSPYASHYRGGPHDKFKVPMTAWPAEIRQGWQQYAASKSLEVRPSTLKYYRDHFANYISYNLSVETPPIARWDEVFEVDRIKRCLSWLAARVTAPQISVSGQNVMVTLFNVAQHLERPEYAALQKMKRRLPKPAKLYDKKRPRHTISLSDLEQVGLALMDEGRAPLRWEPRWGQGSSGLQRATRFQTGLIFRLLMRCPRRSREIREMDFDGRLYQDDDGLWQLHYRSDQLKIAEHNGQENELRIPWPADLVDNLEEYRRDVRPKFPNSATSPIVFLNRHGLPLTTVALNIRISLEGARFLQKHLYPHLFRTLWCDAYLDAHPGDWEGAAAMLNDTPETVQAWYRQFRVEQHLKKATDFNAQLFGHGHSNGHRKGTTR